VPGLGYNVMLPRSSNWPRFEEVLNPAYPNAVDRALAVELIQLLWDRGENAGYAQHLSSDPYPGISPKTVLLVEAFGDHQVAHLATEKLARTIGAAVSTNALASGRATATDPLGGIATVPTGAEPVAAALSLPRPTCRLQREQLTQPHVWPGTRQSCHTWVVCTDQPRQGSRRS